MQVPSPVAKASAVPSDLLGSASCQRIAGFEVAREYAQDCAVGNCLTEGGRRLDLARSRETQGRASKSERLSTY